MQLSDFQEIRRQFPHPMKSQDAFQTSRSYEENYCVGGALIQYLHHQGKNFPIIPFPHSAILEDVFCKELGYSQGTANSLAWSILNENDRGNFDVAWHTLFRAIKEQSANNRQVTLTDDQIDFLRAMFEGVEMLELDGIRKALDHAQSGEGNDQK